MPSAELVEATKKRVREKAILFEHKEGSRLVDIKETGTLVRSLGVNPTNREINLLVEQLSTLNADADNPNLLTLEMVENVVCNFLVTTTNNLRDDYHILIRAFRAFDVEGKGYIDSEQLKLMLCARGEAMSEEEANKTLMYASDSNGRIYYEDYAQRLCLDGRTI